MIPVLEGVKTVVGFSCVIHSWALSFLWYHVVTRHHDPLVGKFGSWHNIPFGIEKSTISERNAHSWTRGYTQSTRGRGHNREISRAKGAQFETWWITGLPSTLLHFNTKHLPTARFEPATCLTHTLLVALLRFDQIPRGEQLPPNVKELFLSLSNWSIIIWMGTSQLN